MEGGDISGKTERWHKDIFFTEGKFHNTALILLIKVYGFLG
jgi:hypothetical protein